MQSLRLRELMTQTHSLLCLGISCTNELEQRDAIQHLNNWLKFHPDYDKLVTGAPDLDSVKMAFLTAH